MHGMMNIDARGFGRVPLDLPLRESHLILRHNVDLCKVVSLVNWSSFHSTASHYQLPLSRGTQCQNLNQNNVD